MPELSFHGERLRLSRLSCGLTLDALGESVAVSRQFVQQLEQQKRAPSRELAEAFASVLGVTAAFFARPVSTELPEQAFSFRARRTTLKSLKARVLARAVLFSDVLSELEKLVDFPPVRIPHMRPHSADEIEGVAAEIREHLGIGAGPITSVTRAVESLGVVVASFGDLSEKVDALSFFSPRPVIVQNTSKLSPSRSRFDLAHELGHIVMHRDQATDAREEEEADRFAGAFLLPASGVAAEFPRGRVAWSSLFSTKLRWGISVSAIVHRAYDLKVIDAARYRSANVHIRRRGWHRGEPNEADPERPESLPMAFEALRGAGVSPADVARAAGMLVSGLEQVTGLILAAPTPLRTPE